MYIVVQLNIYIVIEGNEGKPCDGYLKKDGSNNKTPLFD